MMLKGGESLQQSQVYITHKRTWREELKGDRQRGQGGRTSDFYQENSILSTLKLAKHLSAASC